MKTENENKLGQEPAFPLPAGVYVGYNESGVIIDPANGMSKRFYAATQVLCALISNADRHSQDGDCQVWNYHHLSEIAYLAADELLKQEGGEE